MGKKLLVEAISEVELYKYAPWDLPGICSVKLFVFSSVEIDNAICWLTLANACFSLMLNETITPWYRCCCLHVDKSCLQSRDMEWYFFCPRDKKYANCSRTNRSTPFGFWKSTGKDRTIVLNTRIVGMKKTLIFHEGKAPRGDRTDWVMYEYRMEDSELDVAGFSKVMMTPFFFSDWILNLLLLLYYRSTNLKCAGCLYVMLYMWSLYASGKYPDRNCCLGDIL